MPLELPDVLNHALLSAIHSATGLTPGDVLTALTASTFGFSTPAGGGGVLEKALIHDYTGDSTNNRLIDLEDDYQWVRIYTRRALDGGGDGFRFAYALLAGPTVKGQGYSPGTAHTIWRQGNNTSINQYWLGKLTGGDVNKINLGTFGASTRGCNYTGHPYRVLALKFSSVEGI